MSVTGRSAKPKIVMILAGVLPLAFSCLVFNLVHSSATRRAAQQSDLKEIPGKSTISDPQVRLASSSEPVSDEVRSLIEPRPFSAIAGSRLVKPEEAQTSSTPTSPDALLLRAASGSEPAKRLPAVSVSASGPTQLAATPSPSDHPPIRVGEKQNVFRPQEISLPRGLPAPRNFEISSITTIPDEFVPWWQLEVVRPFNSSSEGLFVNLDSLAVGTLTQSAQVKVLADSILVKKTAITAAQGQFDPRAFMESKYRDTSDPVGSVLTVGPGATRWIDENWYESSGIRGHSPTGADVELSQRTGYEDSNSIYFDPNHQGTSQLSLTLTQPLLKGAGTTYNQSVTVLAEIDSNIVRDRFSKDMQSILLDVYRAYWDLYLQRAAYLQRHRLYDQGVEALDELKARRGVDVLGGQITRAEAAVANRESAMIRCRGSIENAQDRLRSYVNDPRFSAAPAREMIPNQLPGRASREANLTQSLVTALHTRPEIRQSLKEIRAAGLRADVAANELLPTLNLLIETYVSGLQGEGDIARAFAEQFNTGRPTYMGGLVFEVPLGGRRTGNAHLLQRRLELRQSALQLEATTANIRAEVSIAVREVSTTYHEMLAKYRAMVAGQAEIRYLTARWRADPGDQQTAGYALDELLSAQDRLAQAEYDFATAEVAYNLAFADLAHATGTLLNCQDAAWLEQRQGDEASLPNATDSCLPFTAIRARRQTEIANEFCPADAQAGLDTNGASASIPAMNVSSTAVASPSPAR